MLTLGESEVRMTYSDLPQPDRDGIFCVEGQYKIVVPYPSQRDLTQARILCVGEQLTDFFRARLGEIPGELPWDSDKVRTWLPIDSWMHDFHQHPTSQYLQTTNWLDRHTHLRRLTLIPIHPEPLDSEEAFPPAQLGLVCPLCTPEGPNLGRLLELARGAQIREGRLVRLDHSPASHLGFSASVVPFLEHDDTNRTLMGVNMMRQWMAASDPELPLSARGWAPWAAGPSPPLGPGPPCTTSSMSVQPPGNTRWWLLVEQHPLLVSPAWRAGCALPGSAES